MGMKMPRCLGLWLLVLAVAAWPRVAGAARFPSETGAGPPVGTTIDGFREVLGPSATEPEHAGEFVHPWTEPSCTTCPPGGTGDRTSDGTGEGARADHQASPPSLR